jgi:hypothetical protein
MRRPVMVWEVVAQNGGNATCHKKAEHC